uniref:Uncharacterized protein n=1 Tax=Lygus hesperus TaxID=30085 RepID=A0A146LKZ2_LYGHE
MCRVTNKYFTAPLMLTVCGGIGICQEGVKAVDQACGDEAYDAVIVCCTSVCLLAAVHDETIQSTLLRLCLSHLQTLARSKTRCIYLEHHGDQSDYAAAAQDEKLIALHIVDVCEDDKAGVTETRRAL